MVLLVATRLHPDPADRHYPTLPRVRPFARPNPGGPEHVDGPLKSTCPLTASRFSRSSSGICTNETRSPVVAEQKWDWSTEINGFQHRPHHVSVVICANEEGVNNEHLTLLHSVYDDDKAQVILMQSFAIVQSPIHLIPEF